MVADRGLQLIAARMTEEERAAVRDQMARLWEAQRLLYWAANFREAGEGARRAADRRQVILERIRVVLDDPSKPLCTFMRETVYAMILRDLYMTLDKPTARAWELSMAAAQEQAETNPDRWAVEFVADEIRDAQASDALLDLSDTLPPDLQREEMRRMGIDPDTGHFIEGVE
jgi:hypothetical protein